MGLKNLLHFNFKAFRLRRFLLRNGKGKRKQQQQQQQGISSGKERLWMMPISHGYYHVVQDHDHDHDSTKAGSRWRSVDDHEKSSDDSDLVVVQREKNEDLELWFFGVFDANIGDGVTKYVHSHLLHRIPKESQITRKSKETMKKAYLSARAKIREAHKADDQISTVGSGASVMVINGEKLVLANMGDYKVIVCRDGEAYSIDQRRSRKIVSRHWSRKLFPVRTLARDPNNAESKSNNSELAVATERIDSYTEFVIIASKGIWEVMKSREAVSLISHIEDPEEAAECLAKEALHRLSKHKISCVIIRFD